MTGENLRFSRFVHDDNNARKVFLQNDYQKVKEWTRKPGDVEAVGIGWQMTR